MVDAPFPGRLTMKQRLMTPGPVQVPGEALLAQAKPMAFHRSVEVWDLYRTIDDGLRRILGLTEGEILLLPTSGTGAMEAAVVNLFALGDRVLVASNGFFGERFAAICRAHRLDVVLLDVPWGRAVDPELVRVRLAADPAIRGVFATFHDTSTGVINDLRRLGEVVGATDALFVVDGVSGVAVSPVAMDAWRIDCLVGASQKGLSAPPGIGFIALGPEAWARGQAEAGVRYFFDLRTAKAALDAGLSPSPWTPPVSTLRALATSVAGLIAEGLDSVYARQQQMADAVAHGVAALGLSVLAQPGSRSQVVTTIGAPPEISPQRLTAALRDAWGVTIAEGLGKLRETTFRIGHAGGIDLLDVVATLFALEVTLDRLGAPVEPGVTARAVHGHIKVTRVDGTVLEVR